MATSSGKAGDGMTRLRFDEAVASPTGEYTYSVRRDAEGPVLEITSKGALLAKRNLSFFIGSGAAARSYLFSIDRFLFQSPVAYYTLARKWDLSPGYRVYKQPFLTRPILPGCLQCHASAVQHEPLTQNAYGSPPFLEGGISCERCHGPGGAHVAAMQAGERGALNIVNPSKLDATRRDDVCAQCHLSGEGRVTKSGARLQDFVAGGRLQDSVAVFIKKGATGNLRVTSHVENLAESACKQGSGDRLWCGTCHNAHTVPPKSQRVSWYRAKCLSCHAVAVCKAPLSARRAKADDCAGCHMPRNPVTDAEHVVYTNHAIGRGRTQQKPDKQADLIPFGKQHPTNRDLGLAYAIVSERENNDGYRGRAKALLAGANEQATLDSEALLRLAALYDRDSDRSRAIFLYESAVKNDPAQLSGSVSLGAIRMEQGNYEEAIRLWTDALRKNPALLLVRTNLAAALLRTGRRRKAETVLQKATDFNPLFVPPKWLVDELRRN